MHLLNVVTLVILLLLVGAELSVSAFVNPSAWTLESEAQARMLGHLASVLGKVMPVWYAAGLLLLAAETWLHRQLPGFGALLTASILWLLVTVGSILFLVPLNNQVIAGGFGWQQAHRSWDLRHRFRVLVLAVSAVLFAYATAR